MTKKFNVTHACGHVEEHEYEGLESLFESRVEWWRENAGDCKACRAEKRKAGFQVEAAKAREHAREHGWPELVGSPAQVTWALKLRRTALTELMDRIDRFKACLERSLPLFPVKDFGRFEKQRPHIEGLTAFAEGRLAELSKERLAAWWIEHGQGNLTNTFLVDHLNRDYVASLRSES